jgi:hypothetical protein
MSLPYKGSCLCGEIGFEVKRFLPEAAHCHYSMCRKSHGAAYVSYGSAKSEDFR